MRIKIITDMNYKLININFLQGILTKIRNDRILWLYHKEIIKIITKDFQESYSSKYPRIRRGIASSSLQLTFSGMGILATRVIDTKTRGGISAE